MKTAQVKLRSGRAPAWTDSTLVSFCSWMNAFSLLASCQGLTLVHLWTQPEPFSSLKQPTQTIETAQVELKSGRV